MMSSTFPVVRKGYDPEAVESFVKEQAEAWRLQLEEAVGALEEWRRRAEALTERSGHLERRVRELERIHDERVSTLEASIAELTWARNRANDELADLKEAHGRASGDAAAILQQARAEAARIVAAAEEETQRWFAAARRRIELAESHAGVNVD